MIRYPLVLPFNPVTFKTNGLAPKGRGKQKYTDPVYLKYPPTVIATIMAKASVESLVDT